jgi:hypothetical protein
LDKRSGAALPTSSSVMTSSHPTWGHVARMQDGPSSILDWMNPFQHSMQNSCPHGMIIISSGLRSCSMHISHILFDSVLVLALVLVLRMAEVRGLTEE